MRRFIVLIALIAPIALASCNKSSSPTVPLEQGSTPHGTLQGTVTIGPNCPGPVSETNPCPTPPSAYSERKVLVFDETKSKVIMTVDLDSHGLYSIDLVPAKYVIDFKGSAADRSGNVPATVTIQQNAVTRLDIQIDTGLR